MKSSWAVGNTGHVAEHNEIGRRLLRVDDFGTHGNGTQDDSVAFQSAIDALGKLTGQDNFGGGTLVLGNKQYRIDTQLNLYSQVNIVGQGKGASLIRFLGSGYCFKNVNNANHMNIEKLSIYGNSEVTQDGAIYIGNGVSDAGFTGYVALRDLDICYFNKSGAVGVVYDNPSHISMDNVCIDKFPNGTAHKVIASMANTGVMSYTNCKFGDRETTASGIEFEASGMAIDGLSFSGCFFGGTVRGIWVKKTTGTADPTRTISFRGCHLEVSNPNAGSEAILIEEGHDISIEDTGIHCFTSGNTHTETGIRLKNVGELKNIRVRNTYVIDVPPEGNCVVVDSSGNGTVGNLEIQPPYCNIETANLVVDTGNKSWNPIPSGK